MNEQALKERLKFIATLENRSLHEVWKSLILERLLARLAHSRYCDHFIFKGGFLLSYYLDIGRETTDLDFLARKINAEENSIKNAFDAICNINMADGFELSCEKIEILDHTHMNYPGYRLRISVKLGKMKDVIQVDIGVGDTVKPKQKSLNLYRYKEKPIFEDTISLQVYPTETIFSEKLETIIARGHINSRMKDFHDILLLSREKFLIDKNKLKINIDNTFQHRKTNKEIPLKFTEIEYSILQLQWGAHLRVLGDTTKTLNLPEKISDLIEEINNWLEKNYLTPELNTA
ncbi:MAG: hypothetical protein A3F10_05845 [Coxiella sp. RIFCSPHIGHO2_12_FULL_42_15]|nr:MAG: hypothetical protein A3F10_05845 [Coxiella sp. RIFCSPHIGHO2_12_FULL_42_15]